MNVFYKNLKQAIVKWVYAEAVKVRSKEIVRKTNANDTQHYTANL